MSREWFAGYVGILNKPKYRRLSPAGRGALLHLWALASTQGPEALWRSRDELLDAFTLDGFDATHLDELVTLHWLDVEPDGALAVHDWDQWQMAASRAIKSQWEARRLREWRRAAKPPPAPPPTGEDKTGHNKTGVRTPYDGVRQRTTAVTPTCRRCHGPGTLNNPLIGEGKGRRHRFDPCPATRPEGTL